MLVYKKKEILHYCGTRKPEEKEEEEEKNKSLKRKVIAFLYLMTLNDCNIWRLLKQ